MPRTSKLLLLITACIVSLFLLRSFINYPYKYDAPVQSSMSPISIPGSPSTPGKNYAFSAFLAAPSQETQEDNDDLYYVGTRMLIYQLLHDPKTCTNNSYPFVVMVTKDVCMLKSSPQSWLS